MVPRPEGVNYGNDFAKAGGCGREDFHKPNDGVLGGDRAVLSADGLYGMGTTEPAAGGG